MTDKELVLMAMKARTYAYTPYSHHDVGAALLCTDGKIFTGCNVENAGYTPSNCAERTAVFKAVSEGYTSYEKIAVVGGMNDLSTIELCAPCGVCRQVLNEFVDAEKFEVILARVEHADDVDSITEDDITITKVTLADLLPYGFGPKNLKIQ